MVATVLIHESVKHSRIVQKESNTLLVETFSTRLGWFATAGRGKVLCGLTFGHPTAGAAVDSLVSAVRGLGESPEEGTWNLRLKASLRAYAAGKPTDFDATPLDLDHLTPFQRSVVQACRQIPRGETLTYGQLARFAGSPNAARAVGAVMRTNRFPLIIPCHRVVGANGQLVGFSAPDGLRMKRRLLEMEAGLRFEV